MGRLFGFSRYVVLIAVIGLLLASIAVYVFGGIVTVTVIVESFGHAEFNAEGSRAFSTEVIEVIDLFLLGTVLFMTSIGLYELFVDPEIQIPEWLSVGNVEQLKFNLVVVISDRAVAAPSAFLIDIRNLPIGCDLRMLTTFITSRQ